VTRRRATRVFAAILSVLVLNSLSGCGWRGLNTVRLPDTEGGGSGAFEMQAQMPDVSNLQPNTAVEVNNVAVGTVTKIERQGWHALVTMRMNGDVDMPANSTITLAQTSLLATLHLELDAPPSGVAARGKLVAGSVIPLESAGAYPDTEQTLSMLSMVLNGGGIGEVQDITQAFSTAFSGRSQDLRGLVEQLDRLTFYLDDQKDDIIAAADSLNRLVAKFSAQDPVLDKALQTIPNALQVLSDQRDNLTEAVDQFGKLSALAADSVDRTKSSVAQEVKATGQVLESLANAGPALTRSLDVLSTYPWIKSTLGNWFRGDYANLTAVFDLTLARLDTGLLTGTRWEGDLTELEMKWGRTVGQLPSPVTARNPLVAPYNLNQGP
jgi:phospholipid/cholesterol/gamma-HCH transport system substrate-binding protein